MVLDTGLRRTVAPMPTVMKVTTVRMNVVSSTTLKPSKMCTFTVKVSSTIVVPRRRRTAVHGTAEPAQRAR